MLLPTVISGLQVYFDRSLGANLLYRFERPQYAEIRKRFVTGPNVKVGTEKEMSAVYGAEHLLRMIGETRGEDLRSIQTLISPHSESTAAGLHLQHGSGVSGDRQGLCARVDGIHGEGARAPVPTGLRQRKSAISERVEIVGFVLILPSAFFSVSIGHHVHVPLGFLFVPPDSIYLQNARSTANLSANPIPASFSLSDFSHVALTIFNGPSITRYSPRLERRKAARRPRPVSWYHSILVYMGSGQGPVRG